MKPPKSFTLVRHGESEYNALRKQKEADPLYIKFEEAYDRDMRSEETRALAQELKDKLYVGRGDHNTRLTDEGARQAAMVGKKLSKAIALPDIIFVSPYERTTETLRHIKGTWPELDNVPTIVEKLLREQSYGIGILYNDWRIFQTFHPDQKDYRELTGSYWYKYPQGESIPEVRERSELFKIKYSHMYSGKNVLIVSHHRTILSHVANHKELSPEEFLHMDASDPAVTCGVTSFKNTFGRLELDYYNKKLWA